jgi:hypothetical protein
MKELTINEIEQVDGAFGPVGAAIGATGGAAAYFLQNQIGGSRWSWADFGASTLGGAATGAFGGPLATVWRFNAAVAGGTAKGVANHYGW